MNTGILANPYQRKFTATYMNRLSHLMQGLFFLLALLLFTGCERIVMPGDKSFDQMEIFDFLWTDLNNRYSYFDEKQIDWEAVRDDYRSRLQADMDPNTFFDLLGDMMAELEDGHVNLLSTFNRSRNWSWFENFPPNYNEQLVYDHYLKTDFKIIGPLHVQSLDSLLYVNYRSFERGISAANMDEIIRLMQSHKGLIIDIRSNGGGNLGNGHAMASRFIENALVYGRQRFKTGPGRADFTPWNDIRISPADGDVYLGKVALLTNRRSYSASTFFAQMMKALPQARIFGDQTGGGGGIPTFGELPNGWTYRFSGSQAIDLADRHIEFGVLPDEEVSLNPADEANGKDSIIEAALEWLKE